MSRYNNKIKRRIRKLKIKVIAFIFLLILFFLNINVSKIGVGTIKSTWTEARYIYKKQYVKVNSVIVEASNKDELSNFFNNIENSNKTVKLTADINNYNYTHELNEGDFTLDLNGHSVNVTSYNLFKINSLAKLTIIDTSNTGITKNITYSGIDVNGKLINENEDYTSGIILGSTDVFVINGGVLNYDGGIISNNEHAVLINSGILNFSNGVATQSSKGAIYANNGTVNISGGYIYENENSDNGGAIVVKNDATLNIIGKSVIAKNLGHNGGGIYATNYSKVNIYNGYISDNVSTNTVEVYGDGTHAGGGGIYCDGNTIIIMNNGNILNNSTSGKAYLDGGGGVLLSGTSEFTLNGGYITANIAYGGAGVRTDFNQKAQFIMNDGTISYNTATTTEGGGVCIDRGGKAYVYAGNIIGNVTNTLEHWGGGGIFCADAGYLYIENAKITENSAGGCGGGIAGCSTGHIYMTDYALGAVIYNNSAAGENWSGSGSTKSQDYIARDSEVFMSHGYQDYFCTLDSVIGGKMLGGGSFNWEGTCDFTPIKIGIDQIVEATEMMGLTSNASEEDIEKGLEKVTLNIIGNYSNTHGGGILCNGSLLVGNSTIFDVGSLLEINATKSIEKGNIANYDGKFKFRVYNEDSQLISTGINDDTGAIIFDTALYFDKEGIHTFIIKEDVFDNTSIDTDTTVYKVTLEIIKRQEKVVDSNNVSLDKTIYEIKEGSVKVQKSLTDGSYEDVTSIFTNKIEYDKQNNIMAQVAKLKVTGNDTTFINTRSSIDEELIPITAKKIWEDNNNVAGKRPVSITLQVKSGDIVVAEHVVNEENNWSYTFELPKYDENGNEINYTVDEKETNEFYIKELTNATTVTNRLIQPDEKIYVNAIKLWEDNGNVAMKRPESVTLQLKNENIIVAEGIVNEETNWEYTFTNLPKYDENGNEINYTVDEKETNEFYIKELTNATTVTNIFAVPDEKIDINATKVWEDNDNVSGKRPTSVTLQVKNGNTVVETGVVSEKTNWNYTFKDLPKYDENGNEIKYIVDEVRDMNRFYEKIEVKNEDMLNQKVLNRFVVPDDIILIDVEKKWEDNDDEYKLRPKSVVLQIKNGDVVVIEQEVNAESEWKYTFELLKYDEFGNEINYTVDEKETPLYYEKIIDGQTIVNKCTYEKSVETSDMNLKVYVIVMFIASLGLIKITFLQYKNK